MKGSRELVEVSFKNKDGTGRELGSSRAYDYFGDGSFYILDSPGHTHGHIAALARVTASPEDAHGNSFILMAGGTCLFSGQFRPTIERSIPCDCFVTRSLCPGALIQKLQQTEGTEPLFGVDERNVVKVSQAQESVRKLQGFDASDNVWLTIALDQSLLDHVEFSPASLNDWRRKEYVDKVRWGFLKALHSTLLIYESVFPDKLEVVSLNGAIADIAMMAALSSLERAEGQFRQLLRSAGLKLVNI